MVRFSLRNRGAREAGREMPILADIEAAMAEVLPTMNRRVAHQPTGSGDLPHRRRGDRSPARLQNLLTEYQYAGKGKIDGPQILRRARNYRVRSA